MFSGAEGGLSGQSSSKELRKVAGEVEDIEKGVQAERLENVLNESEGEFGGEGEQASAYVLSEAEGGEG